MRGAPRRLLRLARRVRPTARGWQALFFAILSLVGARLLGTTQIYQLGYALAGLLLVSLVLGLFLSRGLKYTRQVPEGERLVAGRISPVKLRISNTSRTRSPGGEVVDHLPKRHWFRTAPIGGTGVREIEEPVLFSKRGLYRLGPAEIRTTDPLGLLHFIKRFEERTEVVVYPEIFELASFPLQGRSKEMGGWGSFAQHGDEFSGLREYRRGDDRRHIHWKSVARTGELIVKEFAQSAPQRYTVVLDLHSRGIGSPEVEVEDAVSAAGSVLWHLARGGLPLRLLCTDEARGATTFGSDEAAFWQTMDLLAVARADGGIGLGDFLDEKLNEGSASEELGEGIVLISRSVDDALLKSVERLRSSGISVVVVALATHTYRSGGSVPRRESAFEDCVSKLEFARVNVRVVRRPGGIAAFARDQSAASARGAV